jgi:hypothetical protein
MAESRHLGRMVLAEAGTDDPAHSRGGRRLVDARDPPAVRSQLKDDERNDSTTTSSSPPSTGILHRELCGSSVPDNPLVKYTCLPSVDSIGPGPPRRVT